MVNYGKEFCEKFLHRKTWVKATIVGLVFLGNLKGVVAEEVKVSTDEVRVTDEMKTKNSFDVEVITENIFKSIEKSFLVKRLSVAGVQEIKRVTDSDKTTTVTELHSFFLKTKMPHIPEALISFEVTSNNCIPAKGAADPEYCSPKVEVKLAGPFKFYAPYTSFGMQDFDISNLNFAVHVERAFYAKEKVSLRTTFGFKNLFFFKWLEGTKKVFGIEKMPTTHEALLFSKEAIRAFSQDLFKTL